MPKKKEEKSDLRKTEIAKIEDLIQQEKDIYSSKRNDFPDKIKTNLVISVLEIYQRSLR